MNKQAPKIILICTTSNISFDRRMQRIASAFLEGGFKVYWIGRNEQSAALPEGFSAKVVTTLFKRGVLFYTEYNLRLLYYILRHHDKNTIINSVDLDTLPACKIASWIKSQTLVFDAHEYFEEVPEVTGRPLIKWVWKTIGNFFIKRNKYNYTVNQSLADLFLQKYGQPFNIVRNTPVLIEKELERKNRNKVIAYLGVLNEGRGVEQAVDALELLPEYQLWLIGSGDIEKKIKRKVESLNLSDRVVFHGWVEPDQIFDLLSKARVGINGLENKAMSYELSLANKFFDYIHAELPSVNMNFPEYRKIYEEYKVGVLIDELNGSQIAEAVIKLENQADYKRAIDACHLAKKAYNWQTEKRQLMKFYQNLK